MSKVKVIRDSERVYEPMEGDGWVIHRSREVYTDLSSTLGAGVAIYENCRMPWRTHYDGYYRVIEGVLTITVDGTPHALHAHDAIFIPGGKDIVYEATERASMMYAIYPVDWEQRPH